MVLDRVDDSTNEYVIHNTSFAEGGAVLRIAKNNAYYTCDQRLMILNAAGEFKLNGKNGEEWSLVNEFVQNTMKPKTWYLLPQAYSIILVPEKNWKTATHSSKMTFNTKIISFKSFRQLKFKPFKKKENSFLFMLKNQCQYKIYKKKNFNLDRK